MKVTNHMNYSVVVAGKEIKAGETKTVKDKDFEQSSQTRVISSLIAKRCLTIEESKPKKQPEEVTDELKSFYDL